MIKRHAKLNLTPGGGTVEVNGEPLKGVRNVSLTAGVNAFPALTVDLLLHEVEVNGEVLITVPEKTAASLLALGWTPPADPGPRE